MRAVIRYPGAKWSIAQWIISHFPENYEKLVYLEPFAGSGAVFFNKRPGAVETINDLDSDIVNLFYVLRNYPDELKKAISLTPYSREEYDRSFEPADDPIEKARRYMVKTTQAIGAKLNSKCGWRNHKQSRIGGTACKWMGLTETIDAAASRLRGSTTNLVQIEHMDALQLIARYNTPEALIYLDPPYVRSSRKSGALYRHEMNDEQQVQLLKLITGSQAKIIISGYRNALYDSYLHNWETDSVFSQTTSTEMAEEVIWMNFEAPAKQLTIDLLAEEEKTP